MKWEPLVFYITAAAIFVQLINGGLFVFSYTDFAAHMGSGFVVGILALASLVIALLARPRYAALRLSSIVLFLLVLLQGALGFTISSNSALVIAHYVNSLLIFAVGISLTFYATRWSRMPKVPQAVGKPTPPVSTM